MSKRVGLMIFGVAALVLVAGTGWAQEPAQPEAEKTLTGCLNAADAAGQFELTVQEGEQKGKKVAVKGAADLEKHAKNHTVKLTGSMAKEEGKDVFTVSKIEHVAATCEAATE